MSRSYKVNRVSENEFSKLKDVWNSLVTNSDSDSLFLRWEWVFNWWVIWRNKINEAELLVLVVFDGEEVIGLAPLYKGVRIINIFFAVKRIQFLGAAYQSILSIRTEYLSIVYSDGCLDKLCKY